MRGDPTPTRSRKQKSGGNTRDPNGREPAGATDGTAVDTVVDPDKLIATGKFAEAAALLESEIAALTPPDEVSNGGEGGVTEDTGRRAGLHRKVASLWEQKLGRLDRALHHWQQAFQLEPNRSESLEAARNIYASVGKHSMVAQLYETELEILGDKGDRSRRAQLELELGRLLGKSGDARSAAQHLENALALAPDSHETREALAEVYSSPEFASEAETQKRAGELFVELGKRRMATEDPEAAILYLRRALGVNPYARAPTESLEDALIQAEKWDDLDRLYRQALATSESDQERALLLGKRAQLIEEHLHDREELKRCLEQLAALEPPGGASYQLLRELYNEDEDWPLLAALIETELESLESEPHRLLTELLGLATLVREHLGDRDRAAELLHRVLSIDPANEEALTRYADHFRERRDWRGLADLNEFAIDTLTESQAEAGADRSELIRRLEEQAQLAEIRLGDIERAISTWQRVENLDPANTRAKESLRRLLSRAKMWESLVGMLEQEAQAAVTPEARAEALRRIAQVYRERQVNPRTAIQLYEEIISLLPDDEASLKALAELYEREGDDAGLAQTMRRQLDRDHTKVVAKLEEEGKPTIPREWPVAKRVERLTALRRLAVMYEQRLADVEGVVFACAGVLEILPGDRDALERMERVLDKAGDIPRLEQTLEYHATSATGPAEKAKVLRRLARLCEGRQDESTAMDRWEQVLKAVPSDGEALLALADLYEKHERWGELAAVLERSTLSQKPPEPGTPAAAKRAFELKRYAQVVDDKLGDAQRATRAWRKVIELSPRDRDALAALARLHEAHNQWRELAEILEMQAPLYKDYDRDKATEVALSRARLLEERLGAPAEAARALEELIRDVDPGNLPAHQALRRLYEGRGEFESAVRIAEREMYLTEEPQRKIARGLEIGLLCRDRLSDPGRALMAFERVLDLAPDNDEALVAAADLYAHVGAWDKHIAALERRIDAATEPRERRTLMQRVAQVTAEQLGDVHGAFAWLRRAHTEIPDATTLADLRRGAEAYDLWGDLAQVYEDERKALWPAELDETGRGVVREPAGLDIAAYVAACRELATLAERRLDDKPRAMAAISQALRIQPQADDLLAEAERIAADADDEALWKALLDCLQLPLEVADRNERVALHMRRAKLMEGQLDDSAGAMEELLRAFAWAPDRSDIRDEVMALSERMGNWDDALAVEAALFERAPSLSARVEVLRRKAQLLEEKMDHKVRAFRAHLTGFLLSPEDPDTQSELWRLARAIGSYEESDKTPAPEPPAAHVEKSDPARRGAPLTIESKKPRRDATEELSASDLLTLDPSFAAAADTGARKLGESTMALDIEDLVEIEEKRPAKADPTMELTTSDLIDALGVIKTPPGQQPPPRRPRRTSAPPPIPKGPPPPPPPRPTIQKRGPSGAVVEARSSRPRRELPGVGTGLITLPARPYQSPWDELAAAYEVLPAPQSDIRLRWLFRASEVWETGAEDIGRAFDVLERAMGVAADNAELRARLHRLAGDHGRWDRLAQLYESAAEEAETAEHAANLLMEVAAIRAQQGRTGDTELLYRRVLGIRPEDSNAREKLEGLYRTESRWVDLAALLEERTDPRLGAAAPLAERPALLRELAALYGEKLSHPHDAIDALERLRQLVPDDIEVMDQLAALYSDIGRWSKVIDVLTKICDVAEGTSTAREALRNIGHIYEIELELPDRAIDAYVAMTESWPDDNDANAALDRLYEQHGRWKDLEEVIKRRAGLAKDPDDKVDLYRRRAKVLMGWLKAPDEAAAALRHARTIRPDRDDVADDLVVALIKSGRAREAAAVLEGRIEGQRSTQAATGDVAALLLRLANLRADDLDDLAGARRALEEALELVPDHPTALSALAKLADKQEDPRTYAEARMREAEVLTDVDARVEALFDAGVALRDRCQDIDTARVAFERLLELRPFHAQATWALSGLVEQSGDVHAAIQLLEKRLDDQTLQPAERAEILTQLAALSRQAGVDAAAEKRLESALEVVPDHLPAILARVDLLAEAKDYNRLIDFVEEVFGRLDDKPAEPKAELLRRKALGFEALEADEEAYQTLIEADKVQRGNLLVKLALGENRYRNRRWREAALHLGQLAEHPSASLHPAEVAEGLYHAALAEIRSMRPEKSEALYERAIQLKPNFAPALHALAELAMERGDAKRAADLLTRQATATDDPDERMRLFEALGDMALMTLHDEARAKMCYESAVKAADPLESKHMPLLEKLLERQDLASDYAGAAKTAELMASFASESRDRSARLKVAADNFLAAGLDDKARAAAERAVAADPYDMTAVAIASELVMKDGDFDRAAAMLGRALQAKEVKESIDEVTAPRQSLLWSRLADARLKRGDSKGAITAYRQAIALASDSDGAMRGRRGLIGLLADDEAEKDTLLEYRRIVAADSHAMEDVVDYAKALCKVGHGDGGRAMLELAASLGYELDKDDVGFLGLHPGRVMAEDDSYRGTLDQKERAHLLADADDAPTAQVLATLWEAAALLWSDVDEAQARFGVYGARKLPTTTDIPAVTIFTRIARAVGTPATILYATDDSNAPDVAILCVAPPAVVLGPRLHSGRGEAVSDLELRFLLARAAELAQPERIIAAGLPADHLAALLASIMRVFGKTGDPSAPRDDDEMLRTTLPVKVRSQLEKLLVQVGGQPLDAERYLRACQRAADRSGLLVCGDIDTALRLGGTTGPDGKRQSRHFYDLALSRGYLPARKKLGVGAIK